MTDPDRAPDRAPEPPAELGAVLHTVLDVGANTLRAALTRLPESCVDFEALDAAFDVARTTLGTGGLGVADTGDDPVAEECEGGAGISPGELEGLLRGIEARTSAASLQLGEVDREEASILVQIIVAGQDEGSEARAVARLEELRRREIDAAAAGRSKPPQQQIAGILADAVVDLAEALPIERFDRAYSLLLPTFRRIVYPVLDHLPHLADRMTPHGIEALWPHAVDELLIHLRRRRRGLDPRIELEDPEARARALARLVRLPAIGEARLDPLALEMDQGFVHDLLLDLLRLPPAREVVGRALLGALRRTPPQEAWLANVLRPVERYTPEIAPFLHAAVASASGAARTPALVEAAADILLRTLEDLDTERRGDPWVPGALEWLGAHGSLAAFDFLERVQKERRLLRPTWSKDCRRAARTGIERGWSEA